MMVCDCCGEVIEDDELGTYVDRDYIDRRCVREEVIDEPCHCGGAFVKAVQCAKCGKWIPESQGDWGWDEELKTNAYWCSECADKYSD